MQTYLSESRLWTRWWSVLNRRTQPSNKAMNPAIAVARLRLARALAGDCQIVRRPSCTVVMLSKDPAGEGERQDLADHPAGQVEWLENARAVV